MEDARHRGLEALSNAEEEVEVAGLADVRGRAGVVVEHGIDRWIQVVAEIDADGTNGRSITKTKAYCMGVVVEVAGAHGGILRLSCGDGDVPAGLLVGLMEVLDALEHVTHVLEGVAHVVEDDEGDAVANDRECRRWKPELEGIDDHTGAANGIACR